MVSRNLSILLPVLIFNILLLLSFLTNYMDATPSGDVATDIAVGISRLDFNNFFVGNIEARVYGPYGNTLYLPTSILPLTLGIPFKLSTIIHFQHPYLFVVIFFTLIISAFLLLSLYLLSKYLSKSIALSLLYLILFQEAVNKVHNFFPLVMTYGPNLVAWASLLLFVSYLSVFRSKDLLPLLTGVLSSFIMFAVSLETLPMGFISFLYFSVKIFKNYKKFISIPLFLLLPFVARSVKEGPFFFINYLRATNNGEISNNNHQIFKALYSTFNLPSLGLFFTLLALSLFILIIFNRAYLHKTSFIIFYLSFLFNITLIMYNHTKVVWNGYENYAFWWISPVFLISTAILFSKVNIRILYITTIFLAIFVALQPRDNVNGVLESGTRSLASSYLSIPNLDHILKKIPPSPNINEKIQLTFYNESDENEKILVGALYPSLYLKAKELGINICSDLNNQMPEADFCKWRSDRFGRGIILFNTPNMFDDFAKKVRSNVDILDGYNSKVIKYKELGYIGSSKLVLVWYNGK